MGLGVEAPPPCLSQQKATQCRSEVPPDGFLVSRLHVESLREDGIPGDLNTIGRLAKEGFGIHPKMRSTAPQDEIRVPDVGGSILGCSTEDPPPLEDEGVASCHAEVARPVGLRMVQRLQQWQNLVHWQSDVVGWLPARLHRGAVHGCLVRILEAPMQDGDDRNDQGRDDEESERQYQEAFDGYDSPFRSRSGGSARIKSCHSFLLQRLDRGIACMM